MDGLTAYRSFSRLAASPLSLPPLPPGKLRPPRLLLRALLPAVLLITACEPGRTLEAIRVLRDAEAGDRPSSLKEVTPSPVRQAIAFTVDSVAYAADLYRPGEPSRAGIVLVPGLTPQGRDDARLIAFATTLARARFEVIVPDLSRMRSLQVTAQDAVPIAGAIRWIDARGSGRPVGVAAVSFAVGPAVIALFEPTAQGHADFVLAIGGYYDLTALITYVTTGFYREHAGAPWRYRVPNRYGKWIFLRSNAGRIDDQDDRATLLDIASRKLDDPDADVTEPVARLGSQGRSVYALITNGDPERVPALLAALPPEIRMQAALLDLRQRDLTTLALDFVLIHDRNDRIIPAAQSAALAAALPPGRAHLYVVDGLDHAQVDSLGIADALALVDAVYTLLQFRDARPKAPES